ncbi:MAG: ABC transporter substrate-binding protein [Patescibacteria group bacterium]
MKHLLRFVVVAALAAGGFLMWHAQLIRTERPPALRLGIPIIPHLALVDVAAKKGFFADEGVTVDIKEFTGGKFALQALLAGSLDMAVAAEVPVVLATMNSEKIVVLAELNKANGLSVLLRKDPSLSGPFDVQKYFYEKRKIATSMGSSAEFFLAQFLKAQAIDSAKVEIIGMKPEDTPIALANHSVDGIAIYEPFVSFAKQRTHPAELWSAQMPELRMENMLLVARPNWVSEHPKEVEKILKALKSSEGFVNANRHESIGIVASSTKLDIQTLSGIWNKFYFGLRLDDHLVELLNATAQWAKDTGNVKPDSEIPNFRSIIYDGPLKNVSPSSEL